MQPKIIDLFSGCGGLSLGFQKAGFEILLGVELMEKACDTANKNLDNRVGNKSRHICGDITKMDPKDYLDLIGEEGCIVIGGPPCQAYSMAGKGKLRSLGEERINTNDARGYLFQDFLRFVIGLDAKAAIMENVPESINFGGKNIPEEVCICLENNGYNAFWTILNAADFGVPQVRERVILFAVKKDSGITFNLPVPTHKNPDNRKTFYERRFDTIKNCPHFKMPVSSNEADLDWTTVGQALSDLPILYPEADIEFIPIKMTEAFKYKSGCNSEYQKVMRTWFGKEETEVLNNSFRKTIRDFPIFERMKQGDNFRNAFEIAENIFREKNLKFGYKEGTEEYSQLYKKIVPCYSKKKFVNKWKRLNENSQSHTVVAHLCKDTYSHINPWEPRGISVREAARLQSFPDGFIFECSMGDAFKQIGNAVPPLLSYNVAKVIYEAFKEK